MSSQAARYDGNAEWYDETFSAFHPPKEELAFLKQALGTGGGEACIDLACGTGLWAQPIADAGYQAVGFDISADQLRFARHRMTNVARADACNLPVRDESIVVMVGMFFHTDLEDFAAVAGQVARCLRPGGRFIYAGLHPCFIGPFVSRTAESVEQNLRFLPGYGSIGWASRASGDGSGVGPRVGFHHKALASFMNAITDSGLHIRTVQEFSSGGVVLPRNIGIIAEKDPHAA
ncbi:MAG: class I SAM-dependent methyltransferase [Streptosporangiaceae bacterium]